MNKIKTTLIIFSLAFLLGCQSLQKSFVPTKKTGSDQFLVKKKSPLVMPPSYNELPKPSQNQTQDTDNSQDSDIKSLIINKRPEIKKQSDSSNSVSSLESLILKKIKDE
jgi:hypothetical protein